MLYQTRSRFKKVNSELNAIGFEPRDFKYIHPFPMLVYYRKRERICVTPFEDYLVLAIGSREKHLIAESLKLAKYEAGLELKMPFQRRKK